MFDIVLVRHVCLLALAVACAYTDLARGRLYNAATLGGLAVGLALAYLLDAKSQGFPYLTSAILAAAAGSGILLLIHLLGGLGAGDVKLMAAVGALAPFDARDSSWPFVLTALMFTALVGAAIAVGVLIWQRRLLQGLKDSARALFRFRAKKPEGGTATTIPYGLAIAIGTIWAWMELMI